MTELNPLWLTVAVALVATFILLRPGTGYTLGEAPK